MMGAAVGCGRRHSLWFGRHTLTDLFEGVKCDPMCVVLADAMPFADVENCF